MIGIDFIVVIASGFGDDVWPVPSDDALYATIPIKFQQTTDDRMKDAERVLREHMIKVFPCKEYKIACWKYRTNESTKMNYPASAWITKIGEHSERL